MEAPSLRAPPAALPFPLDRKEGGGSVMPRTQRDLSVTIVTRRDTFPDPVSAEGALVGDGGNDLDSEGPDLEHPRTTQ